MNTRAGLERDWNSPRVRGRLATFLSRWRYDLRSVLSNYPRLYLPIVRWKRNGTSRVVSASTDIVIEGFLRSGNTFTQAAFDFAQQRQVLIAHHLHAPAQVIQATRLNVPTLVIVRPPKDSVVALKLMIPHLSLDQLLRSYIRYHKAILPYLDRCVVATFDQVTSDLGAVITRVNGKYGTSFETFVHTEENVDSIFAALKTMAYRKNPDRRVVGTIPDRMVQRAQQRKMLQAQFECLRAHDDFGLAHLLYDRIASRAVP